MSGYTFLLTEKIDEVGIRMLEALGKVRVMSSLSEEELMNEIVNADALIVRPLAIITGKIIKNAEKLKVIGGHGAGYDNIDVQAASERRIPVTHTPGANAISVAEHTIALILALAKNLVKMDRATRRGEWMARDIYEGIELNGKTCGLVGLGRVGTEVARLSRAFNMNVLYFDVVRKKEIEKNLGIEWITFSEKDRKKRLHIPEKLLKRADFLSIHIPLTKETEGIIGAKELDAMKNGAFIINVARGGVLDEKALYNAIKNRKLSGAALDVFEEEPLSTQSLLLKLGNVVVTPHIAALTKEAKKKMARMAAEDVIRVLKKKRPIHIVNPEVFK